MLTVGYGIYGIDQAYAETNDIEARANETQRVVEETAAAYDASVQRVQELQAQINDNQSKIEDLERKLPDQQSRSNNALRELYKLQREGADLVDLILSASDFGNLLNLVNYVGYIHNQHMNTLANLQQMQNDLHAARADLDAADAEAKAEQQKAEEALKAAQEAREKVQREAQEIARQEALARARIQDNIAASQQLSNERAGVAQQPQQSAQQPAAESDAGSAAITETPTEDNADWSSAKDDFVQQWASRIDNYLAGSPLSGYGATFAAAAWDYGVDPRWSPAISCIESSKGSVCFRSHNAWGWGDVSWGSWEEAIPAHVSGLARGYGYTVTEGAARKYCPPNWQEWYSNVSAEMNSI